MLNESFNQVPHVCKLVNMTGPFEKSSGCGVFVSPKHILTAWHVVKKIVKDVGMLTIVSSEFEKTSHLFAINSKYNNGNIKLDYDADIDIALIEFSTSVTDNFIKVTKQFDPIDDICLTSPKYSFSKSAKGKFIRQNTDFSPDKNNIRPYSEFEFYKKSVKKGMSGSPILNSQGEMISLLVGKSGTLQKLRKFHKPTGAILGPTPERLLEFYEPYRSHVESFHI